MSNGEASVGILLAKSELLLSYVLMDGVLGEIVGGADVEDEVVCVMFNLFLFGAKGMSKLSVSVMVKRDVI